MLGLGEAKHRDSLSLLPLYVHVLRLWKELGYLGPDGQYRWDCSVIGSAPFFSEAAWSREGHQISISNGPQAELTIRGPCWVGLRHYCQL